jgi:hypothetical protein
LGKGGCSDKVNLDGSSHWSNELNWSLEQHSNIKSGGFGFLKWRYPRIIYLYQIFHDKPTSLIGIIDGKLQTMIKPSSDSLALIHGGFGPLRLEAEVIERLLVNSSLN